MIAVQVIDHLQLSYTLKLYDVKVNKVIQVLKPRYQFGYFGLDFNHGMGCVENPQCCIVGLEMLLQDQDVQVIIACIVKTKNRFPVSD